MLLDDDVMTDGKAKSRSFADGLGREERIEHFLLHFGRNPRAIVADPDLHAIAEVFGCGRKGWLIAASVRFRFALRRGIEAV